MVVASIISKEPDNMDDDEYEWLDIIANISSMIKFEKLKVILVWQTNENIEVSDIQQNLKRKHLYYI